MRPLRATILAVAVSVLSSAACTSSNGDDGRIISPTPSGVLW